MKTGKGRYSPLKRVVTSLSRHAAYTAQHISGYLASKVYRNSIFAYWWTRHKNFGDLITPLILKHYGLYPIRKSPHSAEVVGVGSILEHVPSTFMGTVLGAGLLDPRGAKEFQGARILAVRGLLTKTLISAPAGTVLGDPGLLARHLFTRATEKRHLIGLVPHYRDKGNHSIQQLVHRFPGEVVIIDVQRSPEQVFRDIDQCEFILSSSLHGLITADSLGIPNAWITLSDKVLGKGFKFRDYYSALDISFEAQTLSGQETLTQLKNMTHAPPPAVDDVCTALDLVFRRFASEIISRD